MRVGEPERLVIPGWTRVAAGILSGIIVAVVGTQTYFDSRFVNKREHEQHEEADKVEVARIDKTLAAHMESTRLDAVRLATIEKQLERMDGKLDRAAIIRLPRSTTP